MVGFPNKYFHGRFEKLDFDAKDIPKAILIHELLGVTMLALTWSACYHFQISKSPFFQSQAAKMAKMLPEKLGNQLSNIQIPFIDSAVISSRMGTAYIESSVLRKIIRPITLPGKVLLTMNLVKAIAKAEIGITKQSSINEINSIAFIGPLHYF